MNTRQGTASYSSQYKGKKIFIDTRRGNVRNIHERSLKKKRYSLARSHKKRMAKPYNRKIEKKIDFFLLKNKRKMVIASTIIAINC